MPRYADEKRLCYVKPDRRILNACCGSHDIRRAANDMAASKSACCSSLMTCA